MGDIRSQVDAGFFELVHKMTGPLRVSADGERRQGRRQLFSITHRIAPYDGRRFPEESDFFEVRCRDLTGSGFSFLMDEQPYFSQLVAELGEGPNVIYVVAEIVRMFDLLLFQSGLTEPLGNRARHSGYTNEAAQRETHVDVFQVVGRHPAQLDTAIEVDLAPLVWWKDLALAGQVFRSNRSLGGEYFGKRPLGYNVTSLGARAGPDVDQEVIDEVVLAFRGDPADRRAKDDVLFDARTVLGVVGSDARGAAGVFDIVDVVSADDIAGPRA